MVVRTLSRHAVHRRCAGACLASAPARASLSVLFRVIGSGFHPSNRLSLMQMPYYSRCWPCVWLRVLQLGAASAAGLCLCRCSSSSEVSALCRGCGGTGTPSISLFVVRTQASHLVACYCRRRGCHALTLPRDGQASLHDTHSNCCAPHACPDPPCAVLCCADQASLLPRLWRCPTSPSWVVLWPTS